MCIYYCSKYSPNIVSHADLNWVLTRTRIYSIVGCPWFSTLLNLYAYNCTNWGRFGSIRWILYCKCKITCNLTHALSLVLVLIPKGTHIYPSCGTRTENMLPPDCGKFKAKVSSDNSWSTAKITDANKRLDRYNHNYIWAVFRYIFSYSQAHIDKKFTSAWIYILKRTWNGDKCN